MTALELHSLETSALPDPLEYAVLRPGGADSPLPLVLLLHGGNGSRDFLDQSRAAIERAWSDERLPPAVVVTPSAKRSFYMNYRDGSQRWEDAIVNDLIAHARDRHGASPDVAAVCGVSMGGMGALRIAFKHPDLFKAVGAMEPGIEPVLRFGDIELRDRFWRDDSLFESIYGSPIDEEYWAANNPATIAANDPVRLRGSGLQISIECGDLDSFGLYRGTEFLHRVLYDNDIPHDYHLVRGADHLGRSIPSRFESLLRFVGEALAPPAPDESLAPLHQFIDGLKKRAGVLEGAK